MTDIQTDSTQHKVIVKEDLIMGSIRTLPSWMTSWMNFQNSSGCIFVLSRNNTRSLLRRPSNNLLYQNGHLIKTMFTSASVLDCPQLPRIMNVSTPMNFPSTVLHFRKFTKGLLQRNLTSSSSLAVVDRSSASLPVSPKFNVRFFSVRFVYFEF